MAKTKSKTLSEHDLDMISDAITVALDFEQQGLAADLPTSIVGVIESRKKRFYERQQQLNDAVRVQVIPPAEDDIPF